MSSATLPCNALGILRRKVWYPALIMMALVFALPIRLALNLSNLNYLWTDNPQRAAERVSGILGEFFSYHDATTMVMLTMATIGAGLIFFSYLHHRRQVDFYHSLPRRRSRLFLDNISAGLLSVLLPYLVCQGLALAVAAAQGYGYLIPWSSFLLGLLVNSLFVIAILATVSLAMLLTGHGLVGAILAGLFLGYGPMAMGLYQWVRELWQPAWYKELIDWNGILAYTSPISRWAYLFTDLQRQGLGTFSWTDLLVLVIFIGAALALGLLAYSRRPSETAGRALAFPFIRPLVKYPVALAAAAVLAMTMHEIGDKGDGRAWYYLGALLGVFLACQITEIVCAFDFRRLLRRWPAMAITAALVCGVSAFFIIDVPGYNTYVPDPASVSRVELRLDGVDFTWGESDYSRAYIHGDSPLSLSEDDLLRRGATSDPTAIAAVCAMARMTLGEVDESVESYHTRVGLRIRYILSDGRVKERWYPNKFDICEAKSALADLYAADDFRLGRLALFAAAPEQVRLVLATNFNDFTADVGGYYGSNYVAKDYVNADVSRLLAAYEQELGALDVPAMLAEKPVGYVVLAMFAEDPGLFEKSVMDNRYTIQQPYRAFLYPIYPSFTQTIAALEEVAGPIHWELDVSGVDFVDVYSYDYMEVEKWLPAADVPMPATIETKAEGQYTATDPEEIARLIQSSQPDMARNLNGFIELDQRVELAINYFDLAGNQYSQWRYPVSGE